MADTPSAPPLPDGSVDFNAIHSAARQGHDLDKAITAATDAHPDKVEAAKVAAKAEADQPAPVEPLSETKTGKPGIKEA